VRGRAAWPRCQRAMKIGQNVKYRAVGTRLPSTTRAVETTLLDQQALNAINAPPGSAVSACFRPRRAGHRKCHPHDSGLDNTRIAPALALRLRAFLSDRL